MSGAVLVALLLEQRFAFLTTAQGWRAAPTTYSRSSTFHPPRRSRTIAPLAARSVCSRLSEQEASPGAWAAWDNRAGIHCYPPSAEPKLESPQF